MLKSPVIKFILISSILPFSALANSWPGNTGKLCFDTPKPVTYATMERKRFRAQNRKSPQKEKKYTGNLIVSVNDGPFIKLPKSRGILIDGLHTNKPNKIVLKNTEGKHWSKVYHKFENPKDPRARVVSPAHYHTNLQVNPPPKNCPWPLFISKNKDEETHFVQKWNTEYTVRTVSQRNSDVIKKQILLGKSKKLLLDNLAGPIIPLYKSKTIFDCGNNAVLKTDEATLYSLSGKVLKKFKHSGFQRSCEFFHKDLIALVYNSTKDGKPTNNLLIINSKGKVIVDKKNYPHTGISFEYGDEMPLYEFPEAELPG